MKKLNLFVLVLLSAVMLASCKDELSVSPHNGGTFEDAVSDVQGLQTSTQGVYGLLNTTASWYWHSYAVNIIFKGTASGDNMTEGITTEDPVQHAFTFNDRTASDITVTSFWQRSYKMIYQTNKNIEGANNLLSNGSDLTAKDKTTIKQLIGENEFLQAKTYFDLIRTYGRPYYQNPGQNMGVPIVEKAEVDVKPERATVKAVYDKIVSLLKDGEANMTMDKNSSYASKPVAQAMLSRVYLYMEENQNAVDYANKVIGNYNYHLLSTEQYPNLYAMGNEGNPGVIWSIHRDEDQSFQWDSYASLFYTTPGGVGWGQWYASKPLIDLINQHPNDVRRSFIQPNYNINAQGDTTGIKKLNGVEENFMTKFTGQNGHGLLGSIHYIRYAEMFLNRAEANAKMGNKSAAISDVNLIRMQRGLQDTAKYDATTMSQQEVIDAVLRERRLEFYDEGQRGFDIFRNGKTLNRNYPSQLGSPLTIEPTNDKVVFPIPRQAINRNHKLKQNPGYGG